MTKQWVRDQIYKQCIDAKVSPQVANQYADVGAEKYATGQFTKKVIDLIQTQVKAARRVSKSRK